MTQKDLAEKLLVTDKAISRWENGHGYPDIETLEALSAALDISLLELMHSKRNENDTVSLEEASKTLSDTLHMNINDRRKERRLVVLILASSITLILLLSIFKHLHIVAVLGAGIGILYLLGAILTLIDYGSSKSKKKAFVALLLLFVPLSILILLMMTSFQFK